PARPALPLLMELTKRTTPSVLNQQTLLNALIQIDREGKTIAPALLTFLRDRDRGVRSLALTNLARIRQECDVSPLLADLPTTDVAARQTLHWAPRQLGRRAKGATRTLQEITRSPDANMRLEAAETLCKVAPEHFDAGKRILPDAVGEGKTARFDVARALLAVEPTNERALKIFEETLKGDDFARRYAALSSLTLADPSAKALLPLVKPLLTEKDTGARLVALRAHC